MPPPSYQVREGVSHAARRSEHAPAGRRRRRPVRTSESARAARPASRRLSSLRAPRAKISPTDSPRSAVMVADRAVQAGKGREAVKPPKNVWANEDNANEALEQLRLDYLEHLKARSKPAAPGTVNKA